MKKKILCMFIGLMLMAPFVFSEGVGFSAQVSPVGFMNFNGQSMIKILLLMPLQR